MKKISYLAVAALAIALPGVAQAQGSAPSASPYVGASVGLHNLGIDESDFAGIPGIVQAQVAPDGTHMIGTDTSSLLNIPVPNTWHREHLPGGD